MRMGGFFDLNEDAMLILGLAGVWKGAKSLGYLKSLRNGELRSYPQVSKHILEGDPPKCRRIPLKSKLLVTNDHVSTICKCLIGFTFLCVSVGNHGKAWKNRHKYIYKKNISFQNFRLLTAGAFVLDYLLKAVTQTMSCQKKIPFSIILPMTGMFT